MTALVIISTFPCGKLQAASPGRGPRTRPATRFATLDISSLHHAHLSPLFVQAVIENGHFAFLSNMTQRMLIIYT